MTTSIINESAKLQHDIHLPREMFKWLYAMHWNDQDYKTITLNLLSLVSNSVTIILEKCYILNRTKNVHAMLGIGHVQMTIVKSACTVPSISSGYFYAQVKMNGSN